MEGRNDDGWKDARLEGEGWKGRMEGCLPAFAFVPFSLPAFVVPTFLPSCPEFLPSCPSAFCLPVLHSTVYRPAVDGAAAPLFSNQRMTPPAPVQTISIRRSPLMSAVTQPFIAAFVSMRR